MNYRPLQPPVHQPPAVQPVWTRPVHQGSRIRHTVVNTLLVIGAALALLLVAAFLALALGPGALVFCALLALVPLGICLLGLRWIDRWDPEPRAALWFAFLWGAGISVAVTMILGGVVTGALAFALQDSPLLEGTVPAGQGGPTPQDIVGPVLQAPLVEEFAKGLGVLILVLTRRSHFDGPVDGIVYAGTVGAGFAFTENILYFGSAIADAGSLSGSLLMMFVMRGLLSPFAHVMFTALLGVVLGFAVARRGRRSILPAFLLGLAPAIAGHMLWNGGLVLLFQDFFAFYFLLQVPLFAVAVAGVILLRRAERRQTEKRLAEYAAAGWFTPQEVTMLATPAGRSQALHWAARIGARAAMKRFIRTATRLAFTRQRLVAGHHIALNMAAERALLEDANRLRAQLFTMAAGR
jgi:RsiW-degrading membrane proteinase PrsW (M82 family)